MERYKKKIRDYRPRGSRYSNKQLETAEGTSRKGNINTTSGSCGSAGALSDLGKRHPRYLKGKEIGLYYARRKREGCQPGGKLRPVSIIIFLHFVL